jgi:hypothetical protein
LKWIDMASDRSHCHALVNKEMNLQGSWNVTSFWLTCYREPGFFFLGVGGITFWRFVNSTKQILLNPNNLPTGYSWSVFQEIS